MAMIMRSEPIPGVTPGLEPLLPLDMIFIKQKVDMIEAVFGIEEANQYAVFDPWGRVIYMAGEDSDFCSRQFCGASRGFTAYVRDPYGNGISCERPMKCCLDSMTITSTFDGRLLGSISQDCTLCEQRFSITDASGQVVFLIKGPCCTDACCGDVAFDVISPYDGSPVARITKMWSGVGQEYFTNADNFGISFPVDLAVDMKAVLMGAAVLIDFAFYEEKHERQQRTYY